MALSPVTIASASPETAHSNTNEPAFVNLVCRRLPVPADGPAPRLRGRNDPSLAEASLWRAEASHRTEQDVDAAVVA